MAGPGEDPHRDRHTFGHVFRGHGCGDEYFALPAARIVGPNGKVIAVDIDEGAIEQLRQHAQKRDWDGYLPKSRPREETITCEGCADFVFFGIDLHDFSDPAQLIRNAKAMLRPSGLVDLDWEAEPKQFGPLLEKRFSAAKARQLIESAGFQVS